MTKPLGILMSLIMIGCVPSYSEDDEHALRAYRTTFNLYEEGVGENALQDTEILVRAQSVCPLLEQSAGDGQLAFEDFAKRDFLERAHAKLFFGAGVGAYCRQYLEVLGELR